MNTTEQLDQLDQETLDLKNWSKGWIRSGNSTREGVFGSDNHMNIEALLCEVGLHLLYDWEGEYTPKKRVQIIRQHWRNLRTQTQSLTDSSGRMILTSSDFIDSVISDLSALAQDGTTNEFSTTTFEQFEQALPKNGLEDKFLAISNSSFDWYYSSRGGLRFAANSPATAAIPTLYTPQDRIEYRNINTILNNIDEYQWENEYGEESGEEESEDESDEEGAEERKEMCSKGLEILESVMEKDDQRLCEGDFVNLCNLLKELHKK